MTTTPIPPEFETLRELLIAQETFPAVYLHKFVGRNTPGFAEAVAELERRFPSARLKTSRMSASQAHLALTYELTAGHVDEIIFLIQATRGLTDILVVL